MFLLRPLYWRGDAAALAAQLEQQLADCVLEDGMAEDCVLEDGMAEEQKGTEPQEKRFTVWSKETAAAELRAKGQKKNLRASG